MNKNRKGTSSSFAVRIFRHLPFLVLSTCLILTATQGAAQVTESMSSSITFAIKNFGLNVEGYFAKIQGTVRFDPMAMEEARFDVTIDASSVDTGISLRDRHLRKEEYFAVERFPFLAFESLQLVVANDSYAVKGNLMIKGTRREVLIPFTYVQRAGVQTFYGTLSINRRDFHVGSKSLTLSDEVLVTITIVVKEGKII